ncbi:MAG: hypothetical protein HC875_30335 [Anaerolineales bacterium]|nr:hypothetical protein [Anaerolineales bacterium]
MQVFASRRSVLRASDDIRLETVAAAGRLKVVQSRLEAAETISKTGAGPVQVTGNRFVSGSGTTLLSTGAGPCVYRQKDFEASLGKSFTPGALAGIKQADKGLNSDIHASAEFRRHLAGVLARRVLMQAVERAKAFNVQTLNV